MVQLLIKMGRCSGWFFCDGSDTETQGGPGYTNVVVPFTKLAWYEWLELLYKRRCFPVS